MGEQKSSLEMRDSNEKNSILYFLKHFYKKDLFEVIPLAGDGSSRKFFRILMNDDTSHVLMHWQGLEKKEGLQFLNLYDLFLKNNIEVPKIYHFSIDEAYFLMEDLGDKRLEDEVNSLSQSLKSSDLKIKTSASRQIGFFYKQALEELVKIHFLFLEEKEAPKWLNESKPFSKFTERSSHLSPYLLNKLNKNEVFLKKHFLLNIDYKKTISNSLNQSRLLQEINFTLLHFIQKLSKIKPSNLEEKKLNTIFIDICYKLDQEEKRISHRDYHSKNLMIQNQKIRVIDYQDTLLAPVQYDLSSLLFDPYVNLPSFLTEELLDYYFQVSKEYSSKFVFVDKEKFLKFLILQSIQRNFKAIGSFSSFYNLKNETSYLKYIGSALQTIVGQLENFKEYKDLGTFIQDHGLIEKFNPKN